MAEIKVLKEKFRILAGVFRGEHAKQVQPEIGHTEKEYRQVSTGSKRKIPEDVVEGDETEGPSPKRHQNSRASTSKAVRCLSSSETKVTIENLL
ncbi:hypothetical protein G6F56_002556 [Rhizopus delemar]|nr:hypothetical protein G6F56_002556 [Rhizopus delemar]